MTKFGKIVIEANTIEEAEKDLAMIKALADMGAVCGSGSGVSGEVEATIPTPQKSCCGCCCCEEEDEEEPTLIDELYEVLERVEEGYYGATGALSVIASILENY